MSSIENGARTKALISRIRKEGRQGRKTHYVRYIRTYVRRKKDPSPRWYCSIQY